MFLNEMVLLVGSNVKMIAFNKFYLISSSGLILSWKKYSGHSYAFLSDLSFYLKIIFVTYK